MSLDVNERRVDGYREAARDRDLEIPDYDLDKERVLAEETWESEGGQAEEENRNESETDPWWSELLESSRILVRKEIELAKVEFHDRMEHARRGAQYCVCAFALFIPSVLLFSLVAAEFLGPLSRYLGVDVFTFLGGLLLTFALLGLLAIGLAIYGFRRLKLSVTEQSSFIESLKETRQWAQEQLQ